MKNHLLILSVFAFLTTFSFGQDKSVLKDSLVFSPGSVVRLAYIEGENAITFDDFQAIIGIQKDVIGVSIQNTMLTTLPDSLLRFHKLTMLDLSHNAIRQVDIKQLKKFRHLKKLYLNGNPIPEAIIDELQRKLPNIQIYFYSNQFK